MLFKEWILNKDDLGLVHLLISSTAILSTAILSTAISSTLGLSKHVSSTKPSIIDFLTALSYWVGK